ncbi:TylF/MycF/NovP-related O-methyltransferase [Chitinophaga sp. ARDCPP14]|uniref:TylF/MycF/NovP-related O-methyltransferase n=1 Tax=Chitinophaga sp. ARDCPP14 TaxID=3391139 RepID=UPI003F52828C
MIKKIYRKIINRLDSSPKFPADFEAEHQRICAKVAPFTMTSQERVFSLIEAVKYIHKYKIQGDIVECGVWKGGSMLAIAETLKAVNDTDRELFLYDTFEGMSAPSAEDETFNGEDASDLLQQDQAKKGLIWAYSALDTVKQTMGLSQYNPEKINYIAGKVEDTIPARMPQKIALLRLDTDWYESTKHELIHLFPLLQRGGILIIDDYGFWKGARKAVDEYFDEYQFPVFLSRIDDTGRIAIKQ